jgi:hypothetical protein
MHKRERDLNKKPMGAWNLAESFDFLIYRMKLHHYALLFCFVMMVGMWLKVNEYTFMERIDQLVGHSISQRSRHLAEK